MQLRLGVPMQLRRAPARGDCEGVYVWAIREGQYGSTRLNGLHMAQIARYPGPVHEGNGTDVYVIDERADEAQRAAVNTLAKGDGVGPPFEIFAAVSGKRLDPIYASFEVKLDGIRSEAKIDGGRIYEAVITRVKNPVTGEEEELYLDKPSGFTSLRSELGMSIVGRARADGLSFDHDGQYAEYAEFEYSGP